MGFWDFISDRKCEKCGKKVLASFTKNNKIYCHSCYKSINNLEKERGKRLLENPNLLFEEVFDENQEIKEDKLNSSLIDLNSKINYEKIYPSGTLYYSDGKRIKREDFIKKQKKAVKEFEELKKKRNLYPIQIVFTDNSFNKYKIKYLDKNRKLTDSEKKKLPFAISSKVAFRRETSLYCIKKEIDSLMQSIKEDIKGYQNTGVELDRIPNEEKYRSSFRATLLINRILTDWVDLN